MPDASRPERGTAPGGDGPPTSLEKRLEAYDRDRRALLDEMAALDPAQLAHKPVADQWSIVEVLEHLALAERVVLQGLPDASRLVVRDRTLGHRFAHTMVLVVLQWRIPVRAPSPAMIPRGDRTLGEVRRLWDENLQWLRAYVARREGLTQAVFAHPVAGPMTVTQVVRAGQLHLAVHTRQIRQILRVVMRATS
jgi:hypothetical protein